MDEFAQQMDEHIDTILRLFSDHHWRLNSSILVSARIAALVPAPSLTPRLLLGCITEGCKTYARVRVRLDNDASPEVEPPPVEPVLRGDHDAMSTPLSPYLNMSSTHLRVKGCWSEVNQTSDGGLLLMSPVVRLRPQSNHHVHDIGLPFWVQDPQDNSWRDPDEHFLSHCQSLLTPRDKGKFWEMISAITDLRELHGRLRTSLKDSQSLGGLLKRPEYRLLWIPNAINSLSKDVSNELINAAYATPAV
jgi:hypothetical protein